MIAHWLCLAVVAAMGAATGAHTPEYEYQVVEHVDSAPQGWIRNSSALPQQMMLFRIAPRLDRLTEFQQAVTDLSTPGHRTYGKFMTRDQVRAMLQPATEVTEAIHSWLAFEGVPPSAIQDTGDWIKFIVPIIHAERIMQTRFHNFHHVDSGQSRIRTLMYAVPQSVAAYIETIQPTTFFSQADLQSRHVNGRLKPRDPLVHGNCNRRIVPSCLQKLYNFAGYEPLPDIENSIAVTGFLEEYANFQDLQTFYAYFQPDALNSTFRFVSVNGGPNDQVRSNAGPEATLDVQYAFSLAYPIQATFYSTAGRPPFYPDLDTPTNTNEPYADFLDYVLSHDDPPLVIVTSYGDPEQTVPRAYAERVCAQLAQLGARGVSLLFASGDDGVGKTCVTNDGRNTTRFKPTFPSTCPFVTSVGATQYTNPEQAAGLSGGGFSDYFSRPAYQERAVGSYVHGIPQEQWSGMFNRNGRGFPDIAAQGVRYTIVREGRLEPISGTRLVHTSCDRVEQTAWLT